MRKTQQQKQCNSHHNKSISVPAGFGCTLNQSKGRLLPKTPLALLGDPSCLSHTDTIRQAAVGEIVSEN